MGSSLLLEPLKRGRNGFSPKLHDPVGAHADPAGRPEAGQARSLARFPGRFNLMKGGQVYRNANERH
jgi:hypothetical protein